MKLSEALRLGEFALDPEYGEWIVSRDGKPCSGCAVGRTCIAAGYQPAVKKGVHREDLYALAQFVSVTWRWTASYIVGQSFPGTSWKDYAADANYQDDFLCDNEVVAMISDLYEEDRWTIQRIADYIATIEPQDVQVAPEVPVVTEQLVVR